jgi:hypothetical protein
MSILGNNKNSVGIFVCTAILLALALPFIGSAQNKAPASGEILSDSWYSISYKSEKIGYAHIVWESADIDNIQAWKITSEMVPTRFIPGVALKKQKRTTYVNKDNLNFLKYTSQPAGSDASMEISIPKEGHKIILSYPPSIENVEIAFGEKEILALESVGKWITKQPQYLNNSYKMGIILYEERISNPVAMLNIKTNGRGREQIAGKDVEGCLVECKYAEQSLSQNNFSLLIDSNGVFLKQISNDLVWEKTTQEDAKLKKKDKFEKNNRFDPFIPKFTPKKGTRIIILPPVDQRGPGPANEVEALAMVNEARAYLRRMKEIIEIKEYPDKEKDLSDAYLQILSRHEKINRLDFIVPKQDISAILKEADDIFPAKQRIYASAQHLRDQSAELFAQIKRDGKTAVKMGYFDTLANNTKEITALTLRLEIQNTDFEELIKRLANEVKEFNRRAEIVLDFHTIRNIKIGGIIYFMKTENIRLEPIQLSFMGLPLDESLSVRYDRPFASIIINGQFYNENTKIDDSLLLKSINEDKRVLFIYKGEEIITN